MSPTFLRSAFACLAALLVSLTAAGAQQIQYPETRKSDQIEIHHGVSVADPYRWLEDTDSPETRQWIAAQNAVTNSYLASIPEREAIRTRLTELWNYPRHGVPVREGNRYFYTENTGLQNQSVLYVQEGLQAPPRVLLDPNTLSADGTESLVDWVPSRDGRTLAYAISSGGSDWREVRVRDVASRRDLADTVRWVKFSSISWAGDNRGFFYSRYEPDSGNALTRVVRNHKLYYHRLGTPQSQDELIFEQPDEPDWLVIGDVSHDGQYLVMHIYQGTEPSNRVYLIDLGNPRRPILNNPLVRLLDRPDAEYTVVGNVGPVFIVRTDRDAPRKRIVGIDLNIPRETAWTPLIPQGPEAIESARLIDGMLVLTVLQDARSSVRMYEPTRNLAPDPRRAPSPRERATDAITIRSPFRLVRELDLPAMGTVFTVRGKPDDPEMFYDFTSFLYPRAVFRYDVRRGAGALFRAPTLRFDQSLYETKQVFFTSRDGTRVPMFITAKKGIALDGTNPTLLYGYGGFNVSELPGFSVRNLAWLEMGGVYALANIRGGGEYGREWHEAARFDKRQNAFDDFIAAAEYLVSQRYTSPGKLAVTGGSNGGLLVGVVVNQRPELFAAAIPVVGVMDMLRFHKFTIGGAWVSDYGSPDDADQFRTLHSYSPLHNIRAGTRYPATLVITADHDDRAVPGHSFKYAAALQAAQAGPAPILIRIETRAGHGAGTPTSKLIEESTDRLSFLVRELRIQPSLAR
ncbi:MAG TPA: prolyl oligopeptidase family serine peptidase [Gemmatimonadaceae bacterium]|nr:prolyl oligopeptidase family serine peptidase [Gemmatimonadaceae bacterium]